MILVVKGGYGEITFLAGTDISLPHIGFQKGIRLDNIYFQAMNMLVIVLVPLFNKA